jgi:hypothetical protein
MWQLLGLALYGAVKGIDHLFGSSGSSRSQRPPPSLRSQRTQGVKGYTRWDGTSVRGYRRRPPR